MAHIDGCGLPISASSPKSAKPYQKCVNLLRSTWPSEVVCAKGNGAEMEGIETSSLLAPVSSGDVWNPQDLLDKRLHRRPSPRDTRWKVEIAA